MISAGDLRRAEALQRQGLTLSEIAERMEIGRREVIALLYGQGATWTPRPAVMVTSIVEERDDAEAQAGAGAVRPDAVPDPVEPDPVVAAVVGVVEAAAVEVPAEIRPEPAPVEPERPAPAPAAPEPQTAPVAPAVVAAEPRFRLTGNGLWLEKNGSGLSDRLDKAWTGTEAQADAIRARYPRYAGLALEPVA